MKLKELIAELKALPTSLIFPIGPCGAHSYRGYNDEIAFIPTENVSVKNMLEIAERAVGATFQGYKGGSYLYTEDTVIHFSRYGEFDDLDDLIELGFNDDSETVEGLFKVWKDKAVALASENDFPKSPLIPGPWNRFKPVPQEEFLPNSPGTLFTNITMDESHGLVGKVICGEVNFEEKNIRLDLFVEAYNQNKFHVRDEDGYCYQGKIVDYFFHDEDLIVPLFRYELQEDFTCHILHRIDGSIAIVKTEQEAKVLIDYLTR